MEQEVGFRCGTDDGAVAVRSVSQNRSRHVGTVPVKVLRIVAARTQTVVGALCCGRREGENSRDVVPEIRMHVAVVHAVIEARVGHRDDDARAVKS